MKMLLLLLTLCLLVYLGYAAVRFSIKYQAGKKLVDAAQRFERQTSTEGVSLLVLGDSTAVGVGAARAEESIPGLLAQDISAVYVENHARSGATVADLPEQIAAATRATYDVILLQIGGNDIIRFHSAQKEAAALEVALRSLPRAQQTYLMTAGNVGAATLFPQPMRLAHTNLNRRYHELFAAVAERLDIRYVNLYVDPADDPFVREPTRYLSADGLHPSSEGYALWFRKLRLVAQ